MLPRRLLPATALLVIVLGAIGATIAHGFYYRSERYCRTVESGLSTFFGLPVDVGRVRPHSFSARSLEDIQVWLPDRRARIFHSPYVLWDASGYEGGPGVSITIDNAQIEIGSEEWAQGDYMHVLRASLAKNFQEFDVRHVHFKNASIAWPRKDFRLFVEDVDGDLTFGDDGMGEARLTCYVLNGTRVSKAVQISALLDPLSDDFLPEVALVVPTLPLAEIGLDDVLLTPVTRGNFAGEILFRQLDGPDEVELKGVLSDAALGELTGRLKDGPLPGRVDLRLDQAKLIGRDVGEVFFSGVIRDLEVDALLPRLGLPLIGGTVNLSVHEGVYEAEQIRRLDLSGRWIDGSLDALTQALLGETGLTGRLTVRIDHLEVEQDRIVRGDVAISAEPSGKGRGTIRRTLLIDLAQRFLGVTIPSQLAQMLPPTVEYVQMGVKISIDPEVIHITSGHGPRGPAAVTVLLWGQELPLLSDLDVEIPTESLVDQAKQGMGDWRQRLRAVSTRPASGASTQD